MTAHWPQILGIIIGMNLAFAGYVVAFLVGRPLRGHAGPAPRSTTYLRIPGLVILVGGVGYALISLFQIL